MTIFLKNYSEILTNDKRKSKNGMTKRKKDGNKENLVEEIKKFDHMKKNYDDLLILVRISYWKQSFKKTSIQ